jgi:hypothetical protein
MNAGIDYGMGLTNIDHATGIRYGVISQHSVLQAWCDSAEAIYPEFDGGDMDEGADAEPEGWTYEGDGYQLVDCLDSDIMVLKSPYYTHAPFCSPCVPGAGNLEQASDDKELPRVYCLGHDWFDDKCAPYPVYNVVSGKLISAGKY